MSRLLVTQYQAEVEKIVQYGGSRKETSIRVAFQNLLNEYCKPRDYLLIPELDYQTKCGKTVYPDGTVKDAIRLDYGYWESKDRYDDLDKEIERGGCSRLESISNRAVEKKLAKGYPDKNILFEDSQTAVLIQSGEETGRIDMRDASGLDGLITEFINYVPPEVTEIYIINTKGNARTSGERRRKEGGNVFSDKIRVGIAIYFLVRNQDSEGFKVFYNGVKDYLKAEEKKYYIKYNSLKKLDFTHTVPDKNNNWINQTNNDFDELIPLIDKDVKSGKSEQAIFKLFSRGVATQRDEWVYDFSRDNLESKMKFTIDVYQKTLSNKDYPGEDKIKWDRELTKYLSKKISKEFLDSQIITSSYRPYTKKYLYFDKHFNGMTYQWFNIWNEINQENRYIVIPGLSSPKTFFNLASKYIIDLNCLPAGSQCLPLYSYNDSGKPIENITDWGLKQFQNYYEETAITKEEIFYYVYAVLHDPKYRTKYEQNLKRDFPRIPFYDNFRQWVAWGTQLMDLHINYETIEPYNLKRVNLSPNPSPNRRGEKKVKLKADKDKGIITLDTDTSLHNVPSEAWLYKLGNRSAIEWILDQYKEKKPRDKTIAEKFNTYRFADYKEEAIDLLQRVCTVSVRTTEIIQQMNQI